jgi:hypothetical protein
LQLFWRSSIHLATGWLLVAAHSAAARTEPTELLSTVDTSSQRSANAALSTRLDLAATPGLNISLAGGWSAADQPSWDTTHQLFLRGDARAELAGGRWVQTLYAGYTDQRQERRAGVDSGPLDVATLQGTSRFSVGTLHELRVSPGHSVSLGLQALHETYDARERIRLGLRSDATLDASWSHAETRTHSALLESHVRLGRGQLELGGAFQTQTEQKGLLLARAAGSYATRSGIQVLASVGLGFADPSRLGTSLTAAARSGAALAPPAGASRALPRSWQLKASRGFARGKVTLGAAVSEARAQGPLDRLGDLAAHLELASGDPRLHARAQRFESFVAFVPHPTARLELAYLVTAARLREDEGLEELGVTRHAARANLTWTPRAGSSLGLAWRHVGPRREGGASPHLASRVGATHGSYSVVDVSVRHAFGTGLRVFGQVESVLHREREGSGAPTPRVRGTVGIEGAF